MAEFAPSLLAADFADLSGEIKKVQEASYLHLDIMDGMFVPNISFGPGLIADLRDRSELIFDTHLMIEAPERYIKEFALAGSDIITVHQEAAAHLHRVIQQINEQGCQAGVSLNPSTPLSILEYILPDIDLLLIMSVNPGFGGQKFIPAALDKIASARQMIDDRGLDILIEVDGGINPENCARIAAAGADIIVAGSAIFGSDDPAAVLQLMRERVDRGD